MICISGCVTGMSWCKNANSQHFCNVTLNLKVDSRSQAYSLCVDKEAFGLAFRPRPKLL